ncbi:MAG: hypothetical protein WBL85_10605 [Sedimentisphaerales bacterium]
MFEVAEELNSIGGYIDPVVRTQNPFLKILLKNAGQTVEVYFLAIKPYPPILLLTSPYRSDKFDDVHAASFQ